MDFDWSECAKDKDGIQVRKAKVARLKAKSDELEARIKASVETHTPPQPQLPTRPTFLPSST